ncbi:MAG: serine/threonine-protein kinase PknK [Proteobacteria bacterium]|nr:serine/threonine-protein kinase PknK [Pseudomonadota bacterium]
MSSIPYINILGFELEKQLYNGNHTAVFRGVRKKDNLPVVIKLLRKEHSTPHEIASFGREFAICHSLDLDGVVKALSREEYKNTLIMCMKDSGGIAMSQILSQQKLTLREFLVFAIRLSEIVERIHQNDIIHKNINPDNIVCNVENGCIELIDFSISTRFSKETPITFHSGVLEGTLRYISPEQTGRMNRAVDYRTDLYSLGVTLYEMATARLPFDSNDAIELVHCHIAKTPLSPHEVDERIPRPVSQIIMRLLEKRAEDRYNSAYGLKNDLRRCLSQLDSKGEIKPFGMGENEAFYKFQIPQKLYGREKEQTTLLQTFLRTSAGRSEMLLVSGYAGIGKTSLVMEVQKAIVEKHGCFISGKFDQYQRNIPYSALIQAFREFVNYLLTEPPHQFESWKERILQALGVDGQVLIDVIPNLEHVIGEQPPVEELGPQGAKNRFSYLFQNFIRAISREENPLVLFLDDLQWADSASLELLKVLTMDPNSCCFLVVGAYRNNEVDVTHPFSVAQEELKKEKVVVNTVEIENLSFDNIDELITDTLHCKKGFAKEITQLVYEKTKGNAFFTIQFLKSLHEEQLLAFHHDKHEWSWDITKIREKNITDNVVDLMVSKIKRLSRDAQEILKTASSIGNLFDVGTLAIIHKQKPGQILKQFWKCIEEGLVLPLNENYKLMDDVKEGMEIPFKFVHDRVQQAAYSLIPEDEKKGIHLMIGRLVFENSKYEELETKLFDIVNQFNNGMELINDEKEKEIVARLNLSAGKRAKEATAYHPAVEYLKVGIELLPVKCWEDQYELTLSLNSELAEATYLALDFEGAEKLISYTLEKALTLQDKVKIYEVKIQSLIAQNKMREALDQGLYVLKMLNVVLPDAKGNYASLYKSLDPLIEGKSIEDFVELPAMTDVDHLTAMRILTAIASPAYLAAPEVYPLICFVSVKMCIEHGNSPLAPNAYAVHSLILCGMLGQFDEGYRFSQIALKMLDKYKARGTASKVEMIAAVCVMHWKRHLKESLSPLLSATQVGLETGDIEYASYSAMYHCVYSFLCGENLQDLDRKFVKYIELMMNLKQEYQTHYTQIWRQAGLNLAGDAQNHAILKGEAFNEEKLVPILMDANNVSSLFCVFFVKLKLACFFEEYESALLYAESAEKYIQGVASLHHFSEFYFYSSLAMLANIGKNDFEKIPEKVKTNLKMIKNWERNVSENFKHKRMLVEAEMKRISGDVDDALKLYDEAISEAQSQGFTQLEALASEVAGKFILENRGELSAREYINKAIDLYQKWGATAKVDCLMEQYSELLNSNN